MSEYNQKNCDERHEHIDGWCEKMEEKVQKTSNRFLIMISMLSLNIVGVVVGLCIMLARN
jgi:hypothetical protein